MFIESISLQNIRSYTEQTITFQRGSTLLWGEIGSGKSTILYSIEFALFGIIKGINSYDQLLRHGEREGKVSLVLRVGSQGQHNEMTYTIERIIKRSAKGRFTTTASVTIDGTRRELSTSELRYFIHELLGYPTEDVSRKFMLFRYSVYTPQEEMKQILLDDPDSRIATLRKIFDLDRYKHISDNVSFYARYLNAQIKYQEAKKEGLTEREADVTQLTETYETNAKRLSIVNEDRIKQQKEIDTVRERLEKDEQKLEERRKRTEQLSILNTKRSHLQSTLSELTTGEQEIQQTIKKRIEQTQDHIQKIQSLLSPSLKEVHDDDYGMMHEAVHELQDTYSQIFVVWDTIDQDGYTSLQRYLSTAQDHISTITTISERFIETLSQQQRTLRIKREEHQKVVYQTQSTLSTCLSTLQALQDTIAAHKKRFVDDVTEEKRDQIREQLNDTIKKIEVTKQQLEKNRKRSEAVTKTIHTYESKMHSARDVIETIGTLNECPTCLQPVSESYKDAVVTKQQETIRASEEVFSQMNLSLRKMKDEEEQLMVSLDTLQKEQVTLTSRLQQIQKTIDDNNQIKKEITALQEKVQTKEKEREALASKVEMLTKNKSEEAHENEQRLDTTKKKIETIRSSSQDLKYAYSSCLEQVMTVQKNRHTFQETKTRLGEITTQITQCQTERERFTVDPQSIAELKKGLEKRREKQNELQIAITELTKDQSYITQELKKKREEIEEKKKAKEEYTFLQSLHGWLTDYFLKLTQVIERHVFMTIYQEFNESFRKWFDTLIDSEEITVQLDSQFTPLITINGYDAEYQHLSGGEKTATALAYRIALNEILHRTFSSIKTRDLIILDEPTDGFSYQQIDKIHDLLEQIHCSQVIIVSHETKIESYVEHIVRIRKENHVSLIEGD